jgi:hypothetical protein
LSFTISFSSSALVDSGSSINLIHISLVSRLGLSVTPCDGPQATLADGTTLLSCSGYVSLSYTLAGRVLQDTFFVAPIGAQSAILGMPFLERENPAINWIKKSLKLRKAHIPRSLPNPPLISNASPTSPMLETSTSSQTSLTPNTSPIVPDTEPSLNKRPRRRLPAILPTKNINPKRDQVLLFSIIDVTELKAVVNSVIDSASGSSSTVTQLPPDYQDFADVFEEKNADKLPPHRPNVDHEIPLVPGAKPVYGPIYNLSETELKTLKEYIDRMVEKGFIRPSKSPFGSPVLFVKKPDGSLRLCVDYRKLNDMTIKNRYPLPLISELFDRLKHAKYYTRLDIQDAYNRLRIAEGDEWKTAFRTRYGHFEYLVMPFGLTNAPATFQAYANDCLRDFLDLFCIVYFDDVLIFSDTLEEHVDHVKRVLSRLRDYGLTCKLKKCEFHATSVSFLGFVISPDGVSMDPDRVEAITEWPVPTDVHEIQIFLGFANFYRRFVDGYSRVVSPITSLLCKGQKFNWSSACQSAFEELKHRFTSAPILKHFDPDLPIRIHTDASGFAISAIISQLHNSHWHPVAFYSRKCIPAECNYDVPDREMLAVVESMRHWRHYLEGARHPIQVLSDHKNLTSFMSTKVLNRRQARWAELLANYDFVLIHTPGIKNPADGPSRRPDYAHDISVPTGSLIPARALRLLPTPSKFSPENHPFVSNALFASLVGVNTALAPEPDLRDRILQLLPTDVDAQRRRELVSDPTTPWSWQNGLLFYKNLVYIPEPLRADVIEMHHDGPLLGHPGVSRTCELISRNYWFPRMQRLVEDYINSCHLCQLSKAPRHARHGELAALPVPTSPWKGLSCDFITDLPVSNGKDSILVFVDRMTKMSHFIPCLKTTSAPEFAHLFVSYIVKLHGLPDSIVSDRGSIFTSHFWSMLATILKIDPRKSTAFHPQTDGQTERMNQTLETYLRIFCNHEQDDWFDLLPLAEFAYNNASQESTQMSPFYANYGFHPRFLAEFTPTNVPASDDFAAHLHEAHERLVENVKQAQNYQARYYDAKHKSIEFQPGDMVWLNSTNIATSRPSKKLDWKRLGPFKVLKRIGLQAYQLELPITMRNIHDTFHVSLLEPYKTTPIPPHGIPPPPPPLYIKDDQEFYEIEAILDSRRVKNRLQYLIKWKGYPDSDNSWVPLANIPARALVREFHRRNPMKPGSRPHVQAVSLINNLNQCISGLTSLFIR